MATDLIELAEQVDDTLEFFSSQRLRPDEALVVLQFAVDQLLNITGGSIDDWICNLRLVRDVEPE